MRSSRKWAEVMRRSLAWSSERRFRARLEATTSATMTAQSFSVICTLLCNYTYMHIYVQCLIFARVAAAASVRRLRLVLFADGLDVRFAVGVEEVFAPLLPGGFLFGGGNV